MTEISGPHPQIGFDVHGDEGVFQCGGESFHRFLDGFYALLEERDDGRLALRPYVEALEKMITDRPDFIDGHAHLGFALLEQGKVRDAHGACLRGIAVGRRAIPEDFRGRIEWGWLENRPFLRALHGAALCHLRGRDFQGAARVMEEILAYNPNDNQGIRYLLGSAYLRAGNPGDARSLFEREAHGFPPYLYELALLHLQEKDWLSASVWLRRGFCANGYIAEMLCGNRDPSSLAVWHDSNFSEPETAHDYLSDFGSLWRRKRSSMAFLRWLYNHPKILAERARFMECQEELLWEHDFDRRGAVLARGEAIRASIDHRLSEEIVQPRVDRHGRSVFPWAYGG